MPCVSTALAAQGSATAVQEDHDWVSIRFNSLSGSGVCDSIGEQAGTDFRFGFNSLSGSGVCDRVGSAQLSIGGKFQQP